MGKVNPLIHIYAVDSDTEQMHKQTFVDAWYAAGVLMKCDGWENGIKAGEAIAELGTCPAIRFHGIVFVDRYQLFIEKDKPQKEILQREVDFLINMIKEND